MTRRRGGATTHSSYCHRSGGLLVLSLLLLGSVLPASEPLRLALLSDDLGDPRSPENLKIAVEFPESLHHRLSSATADDFTVFVYPDHLDEKTGLTPVFQSEGIYLWRSGGRIFLDVRSVPVQPDEGPATVSVVYQPGGVPEAKGTVVGSTRFAADLADVMLAVDVSSSMNYTDRHRRRVAAARTFIDMARQGGGIGKVGLVTFNSRARLQTPLLPLEDADAVSDALRRVGANGLTSLDAPLRVSLEEFEKAGSRRPAVILLTDGRNEGSRYRDTHLRLAETGVRIFTVGLTELADHDLLIEMAETTGGLYFRAPKDEDLPDIYARLAVELGRRRLLQSGIVQTPAGQLSIPVDEFVLRLAAIADGGAGLRLEKPNGEPLQGGRSTAVHLAAGSPGWWQVDWDEAEPGVSMISVSGETGLFLDSFPPHLRGRRLALGATLAFREQPLTGARVFAMPIPGVSDEPIELYDDGQHGDGQAGDGVYGTVMELQTDAPDQFDITLRADGMTWSGRDFIRQCHVVAVRSFEPSLDGTVAINGDIDFGTLFPGETGSAIARIDLQASGPRELFFDLGWQADGSWPAFGANVLVSPGRRAFELEITIPPQAEPGLYHGRFSVSDRDDIDDSVAAVVRVGAARLSVPEELDLGNVPPGTFSTGQVGVEYETDKDIDLTIRLDGDHGLEYTPESQPLPAGSGEVELELTVSADLQSQTGERAATLIFRAGPASASLPVRWRVQPLRLSNPVIVDTMSDLPDIPELGAAATVRGFPHPALIDSPFTQFDLPPNGLYRDGTGVMSDRLSPWERAAVAIRDEPATFDIPVSGQTVFPETDSAVSVSPDTASFWSAWWVYFLALLLLALLLLLLIAYILYRMGKSAAARMLLASGLANLGLITVFVILLGAAGGGRTEATPTIAVQLVEDDQPREPLLDDSFDLLVADNEPSSASVGESRATLEQSQALMASTSSRASVDPTPPESALLSVRPAMETEQAVASSPLQRRQRRQQRVDAPQPERSLSQPEREVSQPAARTEHSVIARTESALNQGMAVTEFLESVQAETQVAWSDDIRNVVPLSAADATALVETVGMETVLFEPESATVATLGRRRSQRNTQDIMPEPRTESLDPLRSEEQATTPDERVTADPGVEEVRVQPPSTGGPTVQARRGLPVPAITAEAVGPQLLATAASPLGFDDVRLAAPLRPGERQRQRLEANGPHESAPSVLDGGGSPGGAAESGDLSTTQNSSGIQEFAEMRFADEGSPAASDTGSPQQRPSMRTASAGSGGQPADAGSVGPSPRGLAAGQPSGQGGTIPYAPDGAWLDGPGGASSPRRTGSRGGQPGGLSQVPGLTGERAGYGGDGTSPRTGADSGIQEGRMFDAVGGPPGLPRLQRHAIMAGGLGRMELERGIPSGQLEPQFAATGDDEWRRNERRERRRGLTVASSVVDMDRLIIAVGNLSRIPEPAVEKLYHTLSRRLGSGLALDGKTAIALDDPGIGDCLLLMLPADLAGFWNEREIEAMARYLSGGGHAWIDGDLTSDGQAALERLALSLGAHWQDVPADHGLAAAGNERFLVSDGNIHVLLTARNWRDRFRQRDIDGDLLEYAARILNQFLSGSADAGMILDIGANGGGVQFEPAEQIIPDRFEAPRLATGREWQKLTDDIEWRWPSWSDSGTDQIVSDGEGGRALRLDLAPPGSGRAALYKTLRPAENVTGVDAIAMEIYCDGLGPTAVSLALTMELPDGGWVDFESLPVHLTHGWNPVRVPLSGSGFRRLPSGNFTDGLPEQKVIGRLGFFFYRDGESAAMVMVRNIVLH